MSNNNNLTTMIRDITYFFIKFYYEKELKDTNKTKLEESHLRQMIDNLYVEKANELKKYIRDTLKENLNDKYNSFAVENILLEMFNEYKQFTKDNPRYRHQLCQRTAEMVKEPLEVPLTMEGFEVYCYKNFKFSGFILNLK
jgi:hypothetical protein